MKRILLILGVLSLAPLSVFAVAIVTTGADFTVPLTIGGTSFNFTVKQGSGYQSTTVDTSSVTFTLNEGDAVTITSADKKILTNTPYGYSTECEANESSVLLKLPPGVSSDTLTFTPSADTCATGGGAPGGGGGGGGGGAPSVSLPPESAPAPTLPTPPAQLPPQAQAAIVSPVFNRTLTIGSTGEDVKRLQQLLNSDPNTRVADLGVGSSGNETNYFGSLTQKAVQKFQAKYGVVSAGTPQTTGYGLVGPKTRGKLAEVFGRAVPTPEVGTPTPPSAGVGAAPVLSALQAQVQQLLSQIAALQAQLNALQAAPAPQPEPAPEPQAAPNFFPKLFGIPQIGQ